MRDLKGVTALLTGASKGIGPYIARALASEGMNLILAARSGTELGKVASELSAAGVKVLAVPTDVAEREDLKKCVALGTREVGPIAVLVNNAGIERVSAYETLPIEELEQMIRVNLTGPMLLTQLVLPGMLSRRRGHIVNISSISAKVCPPYDEPYVASKAGLVGFTKSLRAEYRRGGVSASAILPGAVETGMFIRTKEESGGRLSKLIGTSSPESVADAVVRAIRNDLPEVLVNPGPTRLLTTLGELVPSLAEWFVHRFGVTDLYKKSAESYARAKGRPGRPG